MNGHVDIALFLLQNGWQGGDDLMLFSVQTDNAAVLKAALASSVTRQGVESAMTMADRMKRTALLPVLKAKLDVAASRHPATFRACSATGCPSCSPDRAERGSASRCLFANRGDARLAARYISQLALIPRRRRHRQWRRSARSQRMGCRNGQEHQMEDTDTGDRELQPGRVG